MLTSWKTIPVDKRQQVVKLFTGLSDFTISRQLEANIHSIARNLDEYTNKCQQIALNLKNNPQLCGKASTLIMLSDLEMSKGTILEDIENEAIVQKQRFEQMLQEKYDMLNDKSYNATLKCRRCGSSEVGWEQKQTRSADEASTVFCTCNKCKNRWTMR
jgi:DNA-directed RNA polymerase subunit M/transcription elongation factor TFIIS